ncbi:tetratricopeptide repeat protein [Pseudomonas aeruginosa]|nr:tetratricopeptide repeat protein [Pseudomonas aeruginosa]
MNLGFIVLVIDLDDNSAILRVVETKLVEPHLTWQKSTRSGWSKVAAHLMEENGMGWFAKLRSLLLGRRGMLRQPALSIEPPEASSPPSAVPATPVCGRATAKRAIIDEHFFRLGDYFGPHARSHSGRWVLSWLDAEPSGRLGGHRESGNGSYLLYDAEAGQVVVRGEMARPNGGHVADSGHFSLEDWHFGSTLSGTFSVFDSSGQMIFAKDVTANIMLSEISPNGLFALFQTANSYTEDGCKMFLIDVRQGKLLFSVEPLAGWPERYEIEEETGEVIAHFQDLGSFRYSRQGDFIDAEKLVKAKLESPRYEFATPAAEQILKSSDLTPGLAREALAIVTRARNHGADRVDAWKAKSLKLQGLAYEALGDFRAAVDAFDEALALDPKIGVKRKRDSLLKKLG